LQVVFCYNSGAHFVKELDTETVKLAIAKKDPLVDSYKLNSNLDEQWLLIVTDAASIDSHELNAELIKRGLESNFNRLYVLDDFSAKTIRVV
jgi:hypothetical protein